MKASGLADSSDPYPTSLPPLTLLHSVTSFCPPTLQTSSYLASSLYLTHSPTPCFITVQVSTQMSLQEEATLTTLCRLARTHTQWSLSFLNSTTIILNSLHSFTCYSLSPLGRPPHCVPSISNTAWHQGRSKLVFVEKNRGG